MGAEILEAQQMDPNSITLMRQAIRIGLNQGATIREVAAEARGLGRGLAWGEDPKVIAQMVEDLLREVDPLFPELLPVEPDARQGSLPL
jgi:hypothetical protein